MGVNLAALLWGFAEATAFFVVPDVLLTWIALDRARAACVACFWAAVGAVVGGAAMFCWGAVDVDSAVAVLERVPAIDRAMCDRVRNEVTTNGAVAVFWGPLSGTPYKIYAVHSGASGVSLILFLIASAPARFVRFALGAALAASVCRLWPMWTLFARRTIHLVLWAAFYAWYFVVFG